VRLGYRFSESVCSHLMHHSAPWSAKAPAWCWSPPALSSGPAWSSSHWWWPWTFSATPCATNLMCAWRSN